MSRCEWCNDYHRPGTSLGAAHRRYLRTRDNGGIAPIPKHNYSTYVNWHCSCGICRRANAEHSRLYMERQAGRAT